MAGGFFSRMTHRRYMPIVIAAGLAAASVPVSLLLAPELGLEVSASVFFLVYLGQIAWHLPHLTAEHFRANVASDDAPALVIFAVTLLVVSVTIASLFVALNKTPAASLAALLLGFATVLFGWLTIHTMAAMHYAHIYWHPQDDDAKDQNASDANPRGLDFPGTDAPCGYDFMYFSFVIGMTAQTSDTDVTTTDMRKINLVHAIVSYFFNTVLVAAAVNSAVSLAS